MAASRSGSIFGDVWTQCIEPAGQTGRWVRAHLLHGETSSSGGRNLHGPGDDARNLILTDKSINGRMRTRVEGNALDAAWDENRVLWYQVDFTHFGNTGHERFFGREVHMAWGDFDPVARTRGPAEFDATIISGPAHPPPGCPNFVPGP